MINTSDVTVASTCCSGEEEVEGLDRDEAEEDEEGAVPTDTRVASASCSVEEELEEDEGLDHVEEDDEEEKELNEEEVEEEESDDDE